MNYYETLYIVHPALESGRLKDIILSLEKSLKNLGGKTLSIDLWGKKRLAYFIDKQKYGTYVLLQFTGEGSCTGSFGQELEHNPNILSYLTTSIEEADVVEQQNDLDIQIAGQDRELQRSDIRSKNVAEKISTKEDQSAKDSKDPSVVEEKLAENLEDPIEDSSADDGEENKVSEDDGDSNQMESVEMEASEENIDSVEKNQDNTDKTTAIDEGE